MIMRFINPTHRVRHPQLEGAGFISYPSPSEGFQAGDGASLPHGSVAFSRPRGQGLGERENR